MLLTTPTTPSSELLLLTTPTTHYSLLATLQAWLALQARKGRLKSTAGLPPLAPARLHRSVGNPNPIDVVPFETDVVYLVPALSVSCTLAALCHSTMLPPDFLKVGARASSK